MQNTSVSLPWIEHQVFVLEPKKPGQTPHVFMDTTRQLTLLDWLKSFSMFLPSDNIYVYIYIDMIERPLGTILLLCSPPFFFLLIQFDSFNQFKHIK